MYISLVKGHTQEEKIIRTS